MSPVLPPEPSPPPKRPIPSSILIIGAGVFGLSTTLALLSNPRYEGTTITLVDTHLPYLDPPRPTASQPSTHRNDADTATATTTTTTTTTTQTAHEAQNPHAASHDSSRIIRPDYANRAYARLALLAQARWRNGFAREPLAATATATAATVPMYRESGIILTADASGSAYVEMARRNTEALGCVVRELRTREEVRGCLGVGTGGDSGGGGEGIGEKGYVNWRSGWVDASAAMKGVMDMVIEKAQARNKGTRKGRASLKKGKVKRLIFNDITTAARQKHKVLGAVLENREELHASLTILALGAWTPSLLDLRGRAEATAQVIAYVSLSHDEAARLSKMPVLLNLSTGMFVIPPARDPVRKGWILKVANHSYGYTNPTRVSPQGEEITTSLPASAFAPIPPRAESALRDFLRASIPWLGERAFCGTRICWYTDTPSGDFLIDYHPGYEGCFLATGGSGHGFKFLPVLGERIVEGLEGRLEEELRGLWRWREEVVVPFKGTDDGSRRGEKGALLGDELRRGREGKSKL